MSEDLGWFVLSTGGTKKKHFNTKDSRNSRGIPKKAEVGLYPGGIIGGQYCIFIPKLYLTVKSVPRVKGNCRTIPMRTCWEEIGDPCDLWETTGSNGCVGAFAPFYTAHYVAQPSSWI